MTSSAAYRRARRRGDYLPQPLRTSPIAHDDRIAGVPVRVFEPPAVHATYLHLHGGGFVYGGARLQDERLERLACACETRVVSVEYRLAPEDPYPAARDDCEAVALAVARTGGATAIGGESAGANLAVVTLCCLRDRHGVTTFDRLALSSGVYDLELSSMRDGGEPTRGEMLEFVAAYAGSADLASADLSPVHADVRRLPRALFVVGSEDPLLDDTLSMARRWREAGNVAELVVLEGEPHGVDPERELHAFLQAA